MNIIEIETITTRDEAEGDLAAAETLGLVTINHAAYGDIEVRYLADVDEYEVRFGDTDELVRARERLRHPRRSRRPLRHRRDLTL